MKQRVWPAALLFLAIAVAGESIADPPKGQSCQGAFLERLKPQGGYFPYGGGLLHWWNPCCFPHCCAPDDYCRKSLPNVCWPACPARGALPFQPNDAPHNLHAANP